MECMKYAFLPVLPVIAMLLSTPARAEALSLVEISNYLNTLRSLKGEFTQVNDDGTISTGQIYLRKPGRIRFEYNTPDDSLVIAGGGQVAVFDGKSNQPPERFPLSKTPLKLILDDNVDLSRAKMVVGQTSDATTTTVALQDPDHPDYGSIQLVFTDSPVELRQWVVADGTGQKTTVVLGNIDTKGTQPLRLFNILAEMANRGY